jgi:ArsR family transcriptional regulator, arsenate/arsenite/antimonite-responsive transcriptional repressor
MAKADINETLTVYKALSDETRLKIVRTIAYDGECGTTECTKAINLSQPTLSHHIKTLLEAKIINEKKEGTSKKYSLNREYLAKLGVKI